MPADSPQPAEGPAQVPKLDQMVKDRCSSAPPRRTIPGRASSPQQAGLKLVP